MAGPNQDIVGRAFEIVSDKTQIEAGESVSFLVSYVEQRVEEGDINLYINNNFIESIPFGPSPISFDYVFRESGTFSLYVTQTNVQESNEVVITVNDTFVQPQGLVSWRINNKIVSSLEMNNKEIQSIVTSDNVVLYNINSPEYDAISLSSNKNILSYANSESCTLSAQLTDNQSSVAIEDETVTFTIYDANDDSIITSLIGNTDSTGLADVFYSSNGIGDIYVKASVGNIISSEVYIEDCTYWNETETTRALTNGSTIYDNDMSVALPSKCEISFDECSIKIGSGGQHRFFLLPKSQYSSGITQPQSAIYFDNETANDVHTFGKRENDSTIESTIEFMRESDSLGNYHTVKYIVDGTTVQMYFDGVLKTTQTLSWIGDYSDYCLSMTRWSAGGISKIKNVKIKPLIRPFNNISLTSDENILSYEDGDTCTLTAQLTDDGSPVSVEGVTVEFFSGSTSLGTADTNSSGIATLTYTSAGVGDMTLTASVGGIIVSETFSIRDFTYIADTMEKLATALTNVTTGNSIYLKDGTYSLPSSYTVSGIKLIGESTNAKIVSSDGQINFTDSIVDTIGMETANVNRPVIYVDGTTTVKNCDCISNLKPWDAAVISVNLNNPNGLITIYGCYFHGNAQSNGFGHSCAAITGQGSVAYNVIIHHNTFNHPCNSGQLHGSDKGKAVCFYNGGSTTGTLNNVHLYCNEYLGCGDTNITVSEEICPDN